MMRWSAKVPEFLLGYRELLYVWVGIAAAEYFTKTHLSAEARWNLYGVAFAAISFWNWHKLTARVEAAEASAGKPEPAPRVFADDPQTLIGQLGNPKLLTAMQVVSYVDKWIVIRGAVEYSGGSHITLMLERGRRVTLAFAAEKLLEGVRRGDPVTAVCQIRPSYVEPWVSLKNCELVRAGQKVVTMPKAS